MPYARARSLLVATLVAAFATTDAGATSIVAAVDNGPYYCSEADGIGFTLEDGPIWSWTCGSPDLVVCVQSQAADFDLESGTIRLSCLQLTPALEPPLFRDDFE
jgi:hypothetical protein